MDVPFLTSEYLFLTADGFLVCYFAALYTAETLFPEPYVCFLPHRAVFKHKVIEKVIYLFIDKTVRNWGESFANEIENTMDLVCITISREEQDSGFSQF